MSAFRRVGLTGRIVTDDAADTMQQLFAWLNDRGLEVVVEAVLSQRLGLDAELTQEAADLGQDCDLVVVVGGDGSLLGAARGLCRYDVPVLGINRGRLGFLTDVSPAQLETSLAAVLAGDYRIESRFLLQMDLWRGERQLGTGMALNDVVLDSGVSARMIEFELYVDDSFVYRQRSDGLIVSTPTGSTAYALSAGGPIMHPGLDALALVPMYPHTLSSRPLVVDGSSEVRIVINEYNELHPIISCDGQVNLSAAPGDVIQVCKGPSPLRLLHPPGHDFYASCRDKLGWANRPGEAMERHVE